MVPTADKKISEVYFLQRSKKILTQNLNRGVPPASNKTIIREVDLLPHALNFVSRQEPFLTRPHHAEHIKSPPPKPNRLRKTLVGE